MKIVRAFLISCSLIACAAGTGGHVLDASLNAASSSVAVQSPAACATITADTIDDCVRLNQIQVLGTHNSYHLAPRPEILQTMGERRQGLEYTHRRPTEQLAMLGIRKVELDVFADPDGSRYAHPGGFRLTGERADPALASPGFKVFRSGAQYVSTDFPETSPFGSGYIARLPGAEGLRARCNPVNAPAGCRDEWLEPATALPPPPGKSR